MEISEEILREAFKRFMVRASSMGGSSEILERAWNMFKEELENGNLSNSHSEDRSE